MDEFDKFVAHINNLKASGVKQATFSVDHLATVLEKYMPATPKQPKQKNNLAVVGDGGKFGDD